MRRQTRRRWSPISRLSSPRRESGVRSRDRGSPLRRASRRPRSASCRRTSRHWSRRTCSFNSPSPMPCRNRSICLNSSNRQSSSSDRHRHSSWSKKEETPVPFRVSESCPSSHSIRDTMNRTSCSLSHSLLKNLLWLKDRGMKIILHRLLVKFKMLPLLHRITAAIANLETPKKTKSFTILTINSMEPLLSISNSNSWDLSLIPMNKEIILRVPLDTNFHSDPLQVPQCKTNTTASILPRIWMVEVKKKRKLNKDQWPPLHINLDSTTSQWSRSSRMRTTSQ